MPQVARKGRFRNGPRISKYTGEPLALELQPADITLLYALAFHYHYLSNTYIAPLWGREYNPTTIRTAKLVDCGYLRIAPEQERNARHYWRGMIFLAIDKKGIQALEHRGFHPPKRTPPNNLRHQAMVDQMMASIEIGVNGNANLALTWWEEILEAEKTPIATRNSRSAYVKLGTDDRGDSRYLHADGYPFIITRTFDTNPEHMFFIGKEADCETESIRDIEEKFANYVEMLAGKLHTSHFGAQRATAIVAAPSDARLNRLMAAWEKVTTKHRFLRKALLFVRHPMFQSFEKPRATGHMITEPLMRVGMPPIILGKPGGDSAG
jgi:hypothetical protein